MKSWQQYCQGRRQVRNARCRAAAAASSTELWLALRCCPRPSPCPCAPLPPGCGAQGKEGGSGAVKTNRERQRAGSMQQAAPGTVGGQEAVAGLGVPVGHHFVEVGAGQVDHLRRETGEKERAGGSVGGDVRRQPAQSAPPVVSAAMPGQATQSQPRLWAQLERPVHPPRSQSGRHLPSRRAAVRWWCAACCPTLRCPPGRPGTAAAAWQAWGQPAAGAGAAAGSWWAWAPRPWARCRVRPT